MITTSLLDTDLYKLFMMQIIFHKYTSASAEYTYKLRTPDIEFTTDMLDDIGSELCHVCNLRFKEEEIEYLRSLGWFKNDFLEFLLMFQLNDKHFELKYKNKSFELKFEGSWLYIMLFEIYALSIISEVYFKDVTETGSNIIEGRKRLDEKIQIIKEYNDYTSKNPLFKFADFGGRRRYSKSWHREVLYTLKEKVPYNIVGTSNVMLAKELELKPIGTMAHEYLQAHQALGCKLIDSQKQALQDWADEYRGQLGIALTDVITMDSFLKDFDLYFCKLFDGCRHDSGDPYVWCDKLIRHYESMGICPLLKTAVFSDGLTIKSAIELYKTYRYKINVSFGIGTHLTNDMGMTPLNHVIKMTSCNNQPVAKISDSEGKCMCKDESYIKYLKSVFKVK